MPCKPPPYQLSIRVQSTLSPSTVQTSFISAHWLWPERLMLLTDTWSCCVERARFCKCDQSSSMRRRCSCYNRVQYSRWKGIQTHIGYPYISKGHQRQCFFLLNYKSFSDMFSRHCIVTHLHLSSLWLVQSSLSPQASGPVTELRVASLRGPAGCSVSVHRAGDNDFPPLPASPPHPKLQWWRWLQLEDFFLSKLQGIWVGGWAVSGI